MISQNSTNKYVKSLVILFAVAVVVLAVLGYMMLAAKGELVESNMNRYTSYILVDELRQSSDDMTKFIRMYTETGDTYYKDLYNDVMGIRDGTLPRPIYYKEIYWDLMLPHKGRAGQEGEKVSLLTLMLNAGFTPDELEILSMAEDESKYLEYIELTAIRAMEGILTDDDRKGMLQGESNEAYARRILNDQRYIESKASIVSLIQKFYTMINARTQAQVEEAEKKSTLYAGLFIIAISVLAVSVLILLARTFKLFHVSREDLEELVESRTAELKESKALTVKDPMLDAYNRRGFLNEMALEIDRLGRYGHMSTLIIVDIDKFKEVNDSIGHFQADEILKDFVEKVNKQLRASDIFGRIGGDEFAIIITSAPVDEAARVAERILEKVNNEPAKVEDIYYSYTISMGLTEMGGKHLAMNELLHRADEALYEAKNAGRNRYAIKKD